MLYLGQLGSKPEQRHGVVLRAGDGERFMENGTVPPIGYICPCTIYIYSAHCKYILKAKTIIHKKSICTYVLRLI